MANDIALAVSGSPIKNGSSVLSCSWTGQHPTLNTYVKNSPTLNTIQSKYDLRFDDPSYYYGSGNP